MTKHPRQSNKRARARSGVSAQAKGQGQVRIIGGQWRGRKLGVADVAGLRPTGDRVRETLFNWLQADIAGAHCIDLFAGSGALGFEALSRHAASVTFVEPSHIAQQALVDACRLLEVNLVQNRLLDTPDKQPGGGSAQIYRGVAHDALIEWRAQSDPPSFDVVFIDPPFDLACQWSVLAALVPEFVSDNALIYIEAPVAQSADRQLPVACELVREKRFGDVLASVLRFHSADLHQETAQ